MGIIASRTLLAIIASSHSSFVPIIAMIFDCGDDMKLIAYL